MGTGIAAVSAQDTDSAPVNQETPPAADPSRSAERAMAFDWDAAGPVPGAGVSSTGTILRTLLTLALAAAAIYGVIYCIKRASRRSETRDPFLKVLASAHLGSNRYTHIVAAGSRAWLVGSAEGGVNLIAEIEDKDMLNAMFLDDSRKSAETAPARFLDFKSILRRLGMPAAGGVPGAQNIRKRRERLKGL